MGGMRIGRVRSCCEGFSKAGGGEGGVVGEVWVGEKVEQGGWRKLRWL